VIRHAGAETRANVFDVQDFHEEFRKLENPAAQGFGLAQPFRVVGKELAIKDPHHGGAGARRRDHIFGVLENIEQARRDFSGFFPEAGIKGGLAAAGLSGIECDLTAEPPQDFDGALADPGVKLVPEASDEKRDAWSGRSHC
jgi:hypothetical protein